jgi:hypothetical protein
MQLFLEIIKITIWPAVVLVSVLILRKGILELILNLKRLKYKELELEFEREAIKLRAEIERDIPLIEPPKEEPSDITLQKPITKLSVAKLAPQEFILNEWYKLEIGISSLLERHGIEQNLLTSIRAKIEKLMHEKIIDNATGSALLELNAYRNKIAHAQEAFINYEMSNAYSESTERLLLYLESL